jgi:hypothetical protein
MDYRSADGRAVSAAVGEVFVIEGTPGLGKSSLLDAARRLAKARSLRSTDARGHELERQFGYGVTATIIPPAAPAPRRSCDMFDTLEDVESFSGALAPLQ